MDLALIETGNGGDLVNVGSDLRVFYGFENMPYLAMFGGNEEQSTPSQRLATQQAFDWWGNNLFMPNNQDIQFNSETERALNIIPLTSAGRILIESAIKTDLQVMAPFVNVTVETAITATDRLEIAITLQKPNNLQSTQFIYIWDATIKELTPVVIAPGRAPSRIFDFSFAEEFE